MQKDGFLTNDNGRRLPAGWRRQSQVWLISVPAAGRLLAGWVGQTRRFGLPVRPTAGGFPALFAAGGRLTGRSALPTLCGARGRRMGRVSPAALVGQSCAAAQIEIFFVSTEPL